MAASLQTRAIGVGSFITSRGASIAQTRTHHSAPFSALKQSSWSKQFLGSNAGLRTHVLQKDNVHADRRAHRISNAIGAPKTGTSGSGEEFEGSPKQQEGVSQTGHAGYKNPPKESTSASGSAAASSSGQEHSGYNEGAPKKAFVDLQQEHAGYENQPKDDHAEKGGAQGHAEYKEGAAEDPQRATEKQGHAGYENPPQAGTAGGGSKQGHSGFQALPQISVLSHGPAGARIDSRAGGQKSRLARSRIVARATGAAVASSGQKQSHAIKAPATVFVAGATGATGQKIVKALLARGLRVKAGVRNVDSAREKMGPPSTNKKEHLELVQTNISSGVDSLASAMKGTDAVVSALGARPSFNFKQPWEVDYQGNVDLAKACQKAGVKKLVIVSALLTNGAKLGQFLNPAFIFLNIFGLALVAKHRAEEYIWKTDLDYTIVRPGGLDRGEPGQIVLGKEDTIFGGSVPREQVAEVAAEALLLPEASYKVVEVISKPDAPAKKLQELFAAVPSVPH